MSQRAIPGTAGKPAEAAGPAAPDRAELCRAIVAAARGSTPADLAPWSHRARVAELNGARYVVKLAYETRWQELVTRLSALKHACIERDPAAAWVSRSQRVAYFHEAAEVWTRCGFGSNVPTPVSRPEDDCVVYPYVEGPLVAFEVGEAGEWPRMASIIEGLTVHLAARHEAARAADPETGRLLICSDPHLHNIVRHQGHFVFVDLEGPPSRRTAVRDLAGRELAIFAYRVALWLTRDLATRCLADLMRWYPDRSMWATAAEYLSLRRRIELAGFRRRRERSVTKRALGALIEKAL